MTAAVSKRKRKQLPLFTDRAALDESHKSESESNADDDTDTDADAQLFAKSDTEVSKESDSFEVFNDAFDFVAAATAEESLKIMRRYLSFNSESEHDSTSGTSGKSDMDPKQLLQIFYQRHHNYQKSLAQTAYLPPQWYRVGSGKESRTYWRYTFQCPLASPLSFTATNMVPTVLLLQAQETFFFKQLEQLIHDCFGDFVISHRDRCLYFRTKKKAQTSAAFAALYHIFGTNGPFDPSHPQNISRSSLSNKAQKRVKRFFALSSPETSSNRSSSQKCSIDSSTKMSEKRKRKISQVAWVNMLFRHGVKKVHIRYQDYWSHQKRRRNFSGIEEFMAPVQLICHMTIHEPCPIAAQSCTPKSTKEEAREEAMLVLLEKLRHEQFGIHSYENKNQLVEERTLVEMSREWNDKEKLLNCDTPYIEYKIHLPSWATWSPQSEEKVILYKLHIYDTAKNKVVGTTPFGIVLPFQCPLKMVDYNDNFTIREYRAKFTFQDTNCRTHEVHMKSPQLTTVSGQNTKLLREFHVICQNWKQYGTGCPLRSTHGGRQYHFVPLKNDNIDWTLIKSIVNNKAEPYLVANSEFRVPYLFILWCCALYVQNLASTSRFSTTDFSVFAILILSVLIIPLAVSPGYSYVLKTDCLENRFLSHATTDKNLPLLPTETPITQLTGESSFFESQTRDLKQQTSLWKELSRWFFQPTFVDFYMRRYGVKIVHGNLNLVSACPTAKLADFNPFLNFNRKNQSKARMLIPELVSILPMPRDLLFIIGAAKKYMIPLEREISKVDQANLFDAVLSGKPRKIEGIDSSIVSLLSDATTIFPSTHYERLEFLGDRVLNHMICINLLIHMNDFSDDDEYEELLSIAKSNQTLYDRSLRSGVARLLHAGEVPWRETSKVCEVPDSHAANCLESIIGAIYLFNQNRLKSSNLMSKLLDRLQLPVSVELKPFDTKWYDMHDFQFEKIPCLQAMIMKTETLLGRFTYIEAILKNKLGRLSSILISELTNSGAEASLISLLANIKPQAMRLIQVALFDANLDGSDPLIPIMKDQKDLQTLGLIRDKLYHVGATALEMMMSRDLFQVYPAASPGDLHLLLVCSLTHDVLTYIFVKHKIHECLFDESSQNLEAFLDIVRTADDVGYTRWKALGGWMIPGGQLEYAARIMRLNSMSSCTRASIKPKNVLVPRYPGIAAGRLCTRKQKVKMQEVENWQFSFKCIIGSFVISFGHAKAWSIIRPLLEETMILTPQEYRSLYSKGSSICSSYESGHST